MMNLVIVESPAKAKTIEKYLSGLGDFKVIASFGHVRDLVKKGQAVDPDHRFEMHYDLIDKNKKNFDQIKQYAKKSDTIWLATDPDREGEAIAWHVVEALKLQGALKKQTLHRISFNQITQKAVTEALKQARTLSQDLVDAQQARRALDYLVGFNLSPVLWRKVHPGLSAGRVQSPALRLICEREAEIEAFVRQEYWTIEATLGGDKQSHFPAQCVAIDGQKLEKFSLTNQGQVDPVLNTIREAGDVTVTSIQSKERKRYPAPPFITSTMQQEASRKLGFGASKTMMIAQQLYEGVTFNGQSIGLITYMRTDSTHLAPEAVAAAREAITTFYGQAYLPAEARAYKTKAKNAQEAHEAIRPSLFEYTPDQVKSSLTADQHKLYRLIWRRALASQMSDARFQQTTIQTENKAAAFRSVGQVMLFDGFLKVYRESDDDAQERAGHKQQPEDGATILPVVEVGQTLPLVEVKGDQHFTEPPPRYSEASLVKALEGYGIGRPSTYAPILSTLQQRHYVELEQRYFYPTDTGRQVNKLLAGHFTQYVDYDFTAALEDKLDHVANGDLHYVDLLEQYWRPFIALVNDKIENLSRSEVSDKRLLGEDPKTGKPVYAGVGRYGSYVQLGEISDDGPKPRYASLRQGQSLYTITLEEALPFFDLPRELGVDEAGEKVSVNLGRFGHYVRVGKICASLRDRDPFEVTLEEAITLIKDKLSGDAKKLIKQVSDDITILNGRYGPYITDGTTNAKIAKDEDPESLTLEVCQERLSEAKKKKPRTRRRKAS